MPTGNENVSQILDQVDTATTAIGTRIQKLVDDINRTAAEGLNGPQTENVLARLGTLVTNLNAMGSDSSNPIPPEPPADPTMPGPFQPGMETARAGGAAGSGEIDPATGRPRTAGSGEIDPRTGQPRR